MSRRRPSSSTAAVVEQLLHQLAPDRHGIASGLRRRGARLRPSREASTPSSTRPSSPFDRASAPQGRSHPPPSPARNARSASTARDTSASSIAASRSRVPASSARHSTASAPWPTCGSITDGSRTSSARCASVRGARARRPRRRWRRTRAAFSRRVAMLPRSSAKARSGRTRGELGAPAHRSGARRARRAEGPSSVLPTSASRGSARSGNRGQHEPVGWWARRAGPWPSAPRRRRGRRARACSTSLTNTPVPPMAVDRRVGCGVAGGRDDHELGVVAEQRRHAIGLPARERRSRVATRAARHQCRPRSVTRAPEGRTARRARRRRARRARCRRRP